MATWTNVQKCLDALAHMAHTEVITCEMEVHGSFSTWTQGVFSSKGGSKKLCELSSRAGVRRGEPQSNFYSRNCVWLPMVLSAIPMSCGRLVPLLASDLVVKHRSGGQKALLEFWICHRFRGFTLDPSPCFTVSHPYNGYNEVVWYLRKPWSKNSSQRLPDVWSPVT